MDINLLQKYQAIEFKSDGTLFGIEPYIATHKHRCPYCGCKLYEMRGKPLVYCRSKKHKNRFVMRKDKLVPIDEE